MTSSLNGLRICIADSNPHMRKLLCELLSFLDVSDVKACKDGREALDTLKSFPADVCIVDLHMQPMDGMAMLKLLRTADRARTRALPVIMVADTPERETVIEANSQGGAEFLLKPVTIPALSTRIRESLAIAQQSDTAEIETTLNTARQRPMSEDGVPSDDDGAEQSTSGLPAGRVASTADDGILVLKE